jgi:hypothetical protein
MLPPSLFAPLDLQAAVEAVRHTQGAHGVVDLLVVTLTDRRVRSDAEIDAHLDTLKAACRQTRRYRDAIPVIERIATLDPNRKHEVAAELAVVHAHLGERAKAASLLEAALTAQLRLPAWRRSLAFSIIAEVAALLLHKPELAQECAALGRSTAVAPPARARRATAPAHTARRKAQAAEQPALPVATNETVGAAATRRRSGLAGPVLSVEPGFAGAETGLTMPAARTERSATPRRRTGLARPVLSAQPTLGDLETGPAAPSRPILTLITGSAA